MINYGRILEAMADGVLIVGADHDILYANPAIRSDFGPAENQKCFEYLLGRKAQCPNCEIDEVLKGKTVELQWQAPANGKVYYLKDTLFEFRDGTRAKLRIFRDITPLKRVEADLRNVRNLLEQRVEDRAAELKKSNRALREEIRHRRFNERMLHETNQLLESIFSNINFLVAYMDADFNFIRVNQAYARADEKHPEFYAGKNHFELFPDAENEAIFRKVVETGEPYQAFERPFGYARNPERGTTYWDWTLNPVKNFNDKVIGLVLVLVNVTRRKQAQTAMLEAEKRFRLMTEAIDDVFWMASPGLKEVLYISPSYEKLSGRSCQSAYASPSSFIEAVHPEDRPKVDWNRAAYKGDRWEAEYRIIRPDGSIRWVRDRGYSVWDDNGNLQMIVGVATDITALKQTESSLMASERQIRRLSAELIAAQEKERKHVAYELHDSLGSGLAAIKMHLENALAEDKIAGGHMADFFGDLVGMVKSTIAECRRIQKGLRPPMLDELGILPTINWHCQQFRNVFKHIAVENTFDIAETDIPVSLKIVIYRVLQEALNNVARHSDARQIRIALVKQAEDVVLTVSDDGSGFDPDLAMGSSRHGLLGMRERVELSGGIFSVGSELGKGTVIKVIWPSHGKAGA